MPFPGDFVWGAATASYQIEGAASEDGKGLSVWDVFTRKPGAVWRGHNGDIACDHYHRFADDVALMRQLGLNAYRFSISWPRVLPEGTGRVNPAGLDFYDRLVDALLEAEVTPFVTLFHWDYPYELYCRGGWLNRDSADWFAAYATVVAERLGDRVKHWFTLNEPTVFVVMGHQDGVHAPGDRWQFSQALRITHHVLLAHGKSAQAIRAASAGPCQVGAAPVGAVGIPATETPADIEAARRYMFDLWGRTLWQNAWWLDPMFLGRYPEAGVQAFAADLELAQVPYASDDLRTICQPLDFFGFNCYNGQVVRMGEAGEVEVVPHTPNQPITSFYWPVTPEALRWGPRFFFERYQKPIYVTENGLANPDWVSLDGKVHDPQRIDFVRRYLLQVEKAIADGVDFRGYFHWSLMDNFEWAEGYKHRFGMIYVDFDTLQRIPKDSAHWYSEVIASQGASLHDAEHDGCCG